MEPNYDLKELEYKVDLTNNDYTQVSNLQSKIPKVVNDILDKEKNQQENPNKINKNCSTWNNIFKLNDGKNYLNGQNQIINCNVSLNNYEKFINFPDCEIVYLIDSTGSMSDYLTQTKNKCIDISKKLMEHYKKIHFKFGAVFYKDPVDSQYDIHSFFPLTSSINQLQKSFDQVTAAGGGDYPEDWVGAYDIILKKMKFTNSTKIIIHISDAPSHGKIFYYDDKYPEESEKLINIIKKFKEEN